MGSSLNGVRFSGPPKEYGTLLKRTLKGTRNVHELHPKAPLRFEGLQRARYVA